MSDNIQESLYNELKSRFESLSDEGEKGYQRLDEAADACIVRWRYAEQSAFELRADFFRRLDSKPGELMDDEPISSHSYSAYGYDTHQRIIYSARFGEEELPLECRFYIHGENYIDEIQYGRWFNHVDYTLRHVCRLMISLSHQKPIYHASYAIGVQTFEEYQYDDHNRILAVFIAEIIHPSQPSDEEEHNLQQMIDSWRRLAQMVGSEESFGQIEMSLRDNFKARYNSELHTIHIQETYEYAGDILKRIVTRPTSPPQKNVWLYNRTVEFRMPYEADEVLFEAARVSMRTQIIESVKAFMEQERLETQVYNLTISYDAAADDGFSLILGTEQQRQMWEENTHEYSYELLYYSDLDTAIYPDHSPYDYLRFVDIYRREQRWDEIRELHIRVARDLNDHDWMGILDTTDDFIVFAKDYEEIQDIAIDIRACIPEAKLRILEEKGLLS